MAWIYMIIAFKLISSHISTEYIHGVTHVVMQMNLNQYIAIDQSYKSHNASA